MIDFGGEYESITETFKDLVVMLIFALVLIYLCFDSNVLGIKRG
ncbi:MAG: hypothetical protein AB1595_07240 [bacterium]